MADREKLLGLIQAAETRIQAANTEQTQAFERLASAEAEDALLEGPLSRPGSKPNPGLRVISSLRDEIASLQARVAGLHRKYAESESHIERSLSDLTHAQSEFADQTIAAFREEYRDAAEALVRVANRGTALFAGLGRQHHALGQINLPDPLDSSRSVAMVGKWELINKFQSVMAPDWDASSLALVNELAPIQQVSAALSKEIERIRSDRHKAAQAALDADAPNRPKSSSIGIPPSYYKAVEAEQAREQSMFPRVEHIPTHQFPNNPEKQTIEFGHFQPSSPAEPEPGNQTKDFSGR